MKGSSISSSKLHSSLKQTLSTTNSGLVDEKNSWEGNSRSENIHWELRECGLHCWWMKMPATYSSISWWCIPSIPLARGADIFQRENPSKILEEDTYYYLTRFEKLEKNGLIWIFQRPQKKNKTKQNIKLALWPNFKSCPVGPEFHPSFDASSPLGRCPQSHEIRGLLNKGMKLLRLRMKCHN